MDCPYYEQLQYAGDTRVQCLVSLFQTGDARLMRNAIDLLNDSRQSDGCTMSRYPTRLEQYIPGLRAVVGRHGARLPLVRGRRPVRAPHAARRAQRAELLRGLSEGERVAAVAALVALFRLGAGVAERRRAAGRRRQRGALRPAASAGVPLGGGSGTGARPAGDGAGVCRARARAAGHHQVALLGRGPRAVRRHAGEEELLAAHQYAWRCWPTSSTARRRAR